MSREKGREVRMVAETVVLSPMSALCAVALAAASSVWLTAILLYICAHVRLVESCRRGFVKSADGEHCVSLRGSFHHQVTYFES